MVRSQAPGQLYLTEVVHLYDVYIWCHVTAAEKYPTLMEEMLTHFI
jgi:hypothetical protein